MGAHAKATRDVPVVSDGKKLTLTREGAAPVELKLALRGSVSAVSSPSGRLLLVFTSDEEEGDSLAAIAESRSGKLEGLVLPAQK